MLIFLIYLHQPSLLHRLLVNHEGREELSRLGVTGIGVDSMIASRPLKPLPALADGLLWLIVHLVVDRSLEDVAGHRRPAVAMGWQCGAGAKLRNEPDDAFAWAVIDGVVEDLGQFRGSVSRVVLSVSLLSE